MVITRANIIKFWLAEPQVAPVPEGYFEIDFVTPPFPDLGALTPRERRKLGRVIAKHPEYLEHEIWCDRRIQ